MGGMEGKEGERMRDSRSWNWLTGFEEGSLPQLACVLEGLLACCLVGLVVTSQNYNLGELRHENHSSTAIGVSCIQFLITTYNRPGKHFYLLLSGTSWGCSLQSEYNGGGEGRVWAICHLWMDSGYSWGSAEEAQDPTEVGWILITMGCFHYLGNETGKT